MKWIRGRGQVLDDVRAESFLDRSVAPWPRLTQVDDEVHALELATIDAEETRALLGATPQVELERPTEHLHVESRRPPSSLHGLPEQKDQLPEVRKAGGFTVEGDEKHLIAKKTGFAKLAKICDTTEEALKDAEAVLIEVDMHQLEEKFSAMIPEFARGAVVHVQSHGYWPAARLTPLLRKAGREDVLVTEAPAPTHAARIDGTVVMPNPMRRRNPLTLPV